MSNFYDDNPDLRFYVEKYIAWEPLVRLTEYDYKAEDGFKSVAEALDFYKDILSLVGNFSANEIAPHAAELDRTHPSLAADGQVVFPERMQKIFDQIKELELHGMCMPRELGGMNAPFLLFMLANELFARSDVSVTAHHGFHGGMAMAALLFSIIEGSTTFDVENACIKSTRFEKVIQEIISGEAWGAMDITEPGAGSDMGALTAKARQTPEGQWLVTGEKIFITSGHAKYHFVVARTEKKNEGDDAFAGLKGLSLFLVPTYKFDDEGNFVPLAQFTKLEEKLGHHGSATVAINFDDTPGWLLGNRGDGFKLMLMIMNNARVGVGFESLGLCECALRMAKDYAAERGSMGKTIDRHEMIADYLDEMETDIQGIRALAVKGAYHEEMGQKLRLMLQFMPGDDAEQKRRESEMKYHQRSARMVTPLVKYIGAEKAVEIARRCIQIHGGFGYSSEYGAEKLLRDAMVLPIYEGTSQIQSLMSMKDNLMGIIKDPTGFYGDWAKTRLKAQTGKGLEKQVARLSLYRYKALQFLLTRLAGKKINQVRRMPMKQWAEAFKEWDPKKDFALAMLHAERLCKILTDTAIVEELAEQAKAYPEREAVLENYLYRAQPRCKFLYEEITGTGGRILQKLGAAAAGE